MMDPARWNEDAARTRKIMVAGQVFVNTFMGDIFDNTPFGTTAAFWDEFWADPYGWFPFAPGGPGWDPAPEPPHPDDDFWWEPDEEPGHRRVPSYRTTPEFNVFVDPYYWEHYHNCGRWPGAPPYDPTPATPSLFPGGVLKRFTGSVPLCLAGQGSGHWLAVEDLPLKRGVPTYLWPNRYLILADYWGAGAEVHRTRHDQHYRMRTGVTTAPIPWRVPWFGNPARRNPNWERRRPGSRPQPERPPVPEAPPPPQFRYENKPSPRPEPARHNRRPPGPGERETKVLSRSQQLGIWMYKILDEFSESAELVDSLFKALPKDVQDRWSKGRLHRKPDQFGQYGLEGADWKLQAIWHNLHRLDPVLGIKNIMTNAIEDRIIGGIARQLPRSTVNAFNQVQADGSVKGWEERVAVLVGKILKELGLE